MGHVGSAGRDGGAPRNAPCKGRRLWRKAPSRPSAAERDGIMRRRKLMTGAIGLALAATAVGLWQPAFSQTADALTPAPAAAAAVAWTGTWAVSPQSSGTTFNQQTLRQIVHTSIFGTAARAQLPNAFAKH